MTENRQPYALVFGVSVFDICGFTDKIIDAMTLTQVK